MKIRSKLVIGAAVAGTDPHIRLSLEYAFLLAGVMVGATVLSVAASMNRTNREDREREYQR